MLDAASKKSRHRKQGKRTLKSTNTKTVAKKEKGFSKTSRRRHLWIAVSIGGILVITIWIAGFKHFTENEKFANTILDVDTTEEISTLRGKFNESLGAVKGNINELITTKEDVTYSPELDKNQVKDLADRLKDINILEEESPTSTQTRTGELDINSRLPGE